MSNKIFTKECEDFILKFNTQNRVDKEKVKSHWVETLKDECNCWNLKEKGTTENDLINHKYTEVQTKWKWKSKPTSSKLIRQLAKINSQTFDSTQSYQDIANALLIRVKAAKHVFDKNNSEDNTGFELLEELNKWRAENLKFKLDELNANQFKTDVKSLMRYFDDLTGNNYKLQILQMGLEEFVRQTSEEWKELAHLFLFLWKGFQKEATTQLKQSFNRSNNLIKYLTSELNSNLEKVKSLQSKNTDLVEQNLHQK